MAIECIPSHPPSASPASPYLVRKRTRELYGTSYPLPSLD